MNARRKFKKKSFETQLAEARAHHLADQKTIGDLNLALNLEKFRVQKLEAELGEMKERYGAAAALYEEVFAGKPGGLNAVAPAE